jgi:hypothetical protein
MTRSDLQADDEQVERLRSYFDDDGIIELTGLIAFQNMSSKFNSALGVPAQGFCKIPILNRQVDRADGYDDTSAASIVAQTPNKKM